MTTGSLEALATRLIDYAGLFPPASLSLAETAANFEAYTESPHAWMLGRLIIPAARLAELSPPTGAAWRISSLLGDDIGASAAAIRDFNSSHTGRAVVDSIETRVATPEEVERASALVGKDTALFVEFPPAHIAEFIPVLQRVGAHAKIRTGGVTVDAFPTSAAIAAFMSACTGRIAFKATAGLHHPVRSAHPLTYEPGADSGTMHGFVNAFVAAALALRGEAEPVLVELLDEQDPAAICFADAAISWRGHVIPAEEVRRCRRDFALSFGSCSFREPVEDLTRLGLS